MTLVLIMDKEIFAPPLVSASRFMEL